MQLKNDNSVTGLTEFNRLNSIDMTARQPVKWPTGHLVSWLN